MLARAAADFYWMGRYLERTEHTGRLLEYQLTRLADTPAVEVALGWRTAYRALGQSGPAAVTSDVDEAEAFLIADAYTLAGVLVEDDTNLDSMVSCWRMARENAKQVRPQLPLRVWTCLNRGFLWLQDSDFPTAWKKAPADLVSRGIGRLRLLAGVIDAAMARDDAWRFLELGRFVERLQHQAALLGTWDRVGMRAVDGVSLSWADLLRICGAYDLYCRVHSMVVHREAALDFLIRNPEVPRSLSFAVRRIEELLRGIDPRGARYPLAPPHRMALRLAAAVEVDADTGAERSGGDEPEEEEEGFFPALTSDARVLHELTMATYVDYPVAKGLPS